MATRKSWTNYMDYIFFLLEMRCVHIFRMNYSSMVTIVYLNCKIYTKYTRGYGLIYCFYTNVSRDYCTFRRV